MTDPSVAKTLPLVSGESLMSLLMTDMDPELLGFVQVAVDSFIKWDLVRFFDENPHVIDTAENIMRYIGRNSEIVQSALIDMSAQGILVQEHVGRLVIYSLSTNPKVRNLIQRFAVASEDRQFRVKVVYHIIQALRHSEISGAITAQQWEISSV